MYSEAEEERTYNRGFFQSIPTQVGCHGRLFKLSLA